VLDIQMADFRVQSEQETSARTRRRRAAFIEAAKPYLAAILIVTILLTTWVWLRAA